MRRARIIVLLIGAIGLAACAEEETVIPELDTKTAHDRYALVREWLRDEDMIQANLEGLSEIEAIVCKLGDLPFMHLVATTEWHCHLEERARTLLASGASVQRRVDAKSLGSGVTPLHYAVREGTARHVALLVRLGADIDARTALGETPLMWACQEPGERGEAARVLVSLDADAALKDAEGLTAQDHATQTLTVLASLGAQTLAKDILEAGRDPDQLRRALAGAEALHATMEDGHAALRLATVSAGNALLHVVRVAK